jgi:hypothetical protein
MRSTVCQTGRWRGADKLRTSGCQGYAELDTLESCIDKGKQKYDTVRTHLKNFTLLFLGQAVVFDAYNLLIRESLLQRRWQKHAGICPTLLAPVAFSVDTEGMVSTQPI